MVNRKLHLIDATDKTVGRLSTQIATILRGKHKPEFTPHIDAGDVVQVTNIQKLRFTGRKLDQKEYYRHSGYPGGLKTTKMSHLFKAKPADVLRRAVREMLPDNKLRSNMLKRLIIK